jgi:hypothetical protein
VKHSAHKNTVVDGSGFIFCHGMAVCSGDAIL